MTWRMVTRKSVRNLQYGLLITSTVWGLDYLLPPTEDTNFLNFVETHSPFPLWYWGAMMVVFGTIGILAETRISRDTVKYRRWWAGVWFSHIIFACVFITLAVGSSITLIEQHNGFSGFRTPILWIFIAILHLSYAQRVDKNVVDIRASDLVD